MAKNFTPEQLSAINTSDKTLLVSAAAGAGKTSTLTERIVRSLTRDKNPENIGKMLIVTFTNDATDQLRGDIREAIEKKLSENPDNKKLEEQLALLPMASISTIDSFCNDILRKNSDKVGIPPNYRIADKAELQILSFSILSKLIGEFYENKRTDIMSSEEFASLADVLTASKSDSGLEESLLLLYEKSKTSIPGVNIFKILADKYDGLNPDDNDYARFSVKILKNAASYCEKVTTALADELSLSSCEHDVLCGEDLYKNAEIFHALSLEDDYLTLREALKNLKYKNFTPIPKGQEKSPLMEETAELFNKKIKPEIKNIYDSYFFYSKEELLELFEGFHKIFNLLSKFLVTFDELYMQEKIKRLALEYADIERFAFKSLYEDDNETLTDFALALKEEYSSVYIDEYQDVNALQSKIFDAVSRDDNRFMVGDIKQSIYSFRSADPDVFASMKKSFPKLDAEASCSAFSIFMSQNFRSEKHIIDFVNEVFDTCFGLAGESIGYLPEDRLVFAKNSPTDANKKAFVCLVPERAKNAEDGKKTATRTDDDETQDVESAEKETEADELQCKYVAKKISEILADKSADVSPKDIAIIIRKNYRMSAYAKALSELGINTKNIGDKNFFLNSEIQLALCLLNAIDNPEKDIYLAGLLASPIFNFTPDELLMISKEKKASLFKSLVSYTKENSFEKGRKFIEKLEFYRTLAEGLSVDSLILRLYNDTCLTELAKRSGGEDNLLLLYNYAKNFSQSSLKGLYNFIKFINNVIDRNADFEAAQSGDDSDAVNIISVHRSKGLQYKVVFYVDTNSGLTNKDAYERIAFSEKFGISTNLRSPGGLALVANPVHNALNTFRKMRFLEEEFRVIYVALTRAVSELYIVGKVPEDYDTYLRKIDFKAKHLNEFSIYKMKSALELILMTAKKRTTVIVNELNEEITLDDNGTAKKLCAEEEADTSLKDDAAPQENKGSENAPVSDTFTLSEHELENRIGFSYAKKHLTRIPEKISVSVLKPRMLDDFDDAEEKPSAVRNSGAEKQIPKERRKIKPEFTEESSSEKSAKRGIATHNFLQFFDIASFDMNGAEAELSRLIARGFISKANGALVEMSEIEKFRKSQFFTEMKKAEKIYREFRFNTRLPAKYFNFEDEILEKITDEELLVQGVIDCILVDSDGEIHLVDYKTDRLKKEELENPEKAAKKLNESHAPQLSCYALTIEKIFGKKPKTVRVYSLPLGDTVDIKLLNFDKI